MKKNNLFNENEFQQYYLSKLCFFNEEEQEKVSNFKSELYLKISQVLKNKNQKSIKELIEYSNAVSSYGGIAIFAIIDYENDKILKELILFLIFEYRKNIDSKDEYNKDLFEIICSFSILSPLNVIRSIILNFSNEDLHDILNLLIKRSPSLINYFVILSELSMQTGNDIYFKKINELFDKLIQKISETSELIMDLKDPLNTKLKEFLILFKKYSSEDKKKSIENLGLISARKLDLANLFHGFCMISPSSAVEYINKNFNEERFELFLKQMKIYQILEIYNLFYLINRDSALFLYISKYIEENYNLKDDQIEVKLQSIAMLKEENSCGILIRQISLMPVENNSSILDCLDKMAYKLNVLLNNLTANISDKTLSISVVSLSRNNLIKEFEDKLVLKNPLLKKLRDKDVMSKIKNTNVSGLTYDQISCRFYISTLLSLIEILKNNPTLEREELILEAYKLIVKKYNHVVKKSFFEKICDIFFSKIQISEAEYRNA